MQIDLELARRRQEELSRAAEPSRAAAPARDGDGDSRYSLGRLARRIALAPAPAPMDGAYGNASHS